MWSINCLKGSFIKKAAIIVAFGVCCLIGIMITFLNQTTEKRTEIKPKAIDMARIVCVSIEHISFANNEKKRLLYVMDALANDVIQIFSELKKIRFPIYIACGFSKRNIRNGGLPSLHAYGAAIDINYLVNPYYNVIKKTIFPERKEDPVEDRVMISKQLVSFGLSEEEIKSVMKVVIQENGNEDWFLNRGIRRKGMITEQVRNIFKAHGFNIWGGNWRQPMDYMHFQIPRKLAEQLANSSKEEAEKLWEEHKRRIAME